MKQEEYTMHEPVDWHSSPSSSALVGGTELPHQQEGLFYTTATSTQHHHHHLPTTIDSTSATSFHLSDIDNQAYAGALKRRYEQQFDEGDQSRAKRLRSSPTSPSPGSLMFVDTTAHHQQLHHHHSHPSMFHTLTSPHSPFPIHTTTTSPYSHVHSDTSSNPLIDEIDILNDPSYNSVTSADAHRRLMGSSPIPLQIQQFTIPQAMNLPSNLVITGNVFGINGNNGHSPSPIGTATNNTIMSHQQQTLVYATTNGGDKSPPGSSKRYKFKAYVPKVDSQSKGFEDDEENGHEYNKGPWTKEEHELFLQGYKECGRQWKHISEQFVRTRDRRQVSSHAQKHFQKLKEQSGEAEPTSSRKKRTTTSRARKPKREEEEEDDYEEDSA
jgi:SHAQKYF class myb-like DNA-binding protein